MNIRLTKIKFAIVLCGTFVATVVFGQTTRIWTGGNGAGIEIGVATNWDTGLPSTALGDTAQWNGTVPGNLSLVYNTNTFQSGFQQSGINLHLTSSQTGAVSISRTPGMFGPVGGPIAIYHITIDAGAGAFTLALAELLGPGAQLWAIDRDGTEYTLRPPKVTAVDATGAGDSFRAGVIHGLRQKWSLPETLRWAAAVGALQIQRSLSQDRPPSTERIADLAASLEVRSTRP